MKRVEVILLLLIFLGAFAVRLYKLNSPLLDWHSWRQSDTSAVSRHFAENGYDLLHPSMDNISNVQSGKENPKGYFFVEFPIYNAMQAGLYQTFDRLSIEAWGRLVSIFSSLIVMVFIYLLVKRNAGT